MKRLGKKHPFYKLFGKFIEEGEILMSNIDSSFSLDSTCKRELVVKPEINPSTYKGDMVSIQSKLLNSCCGVLELGDFSSAYIDFGDIEHRNIYKGIIEYIVSKARKFAHEDNPESIWPVDSKVGAIIMTDVQGEILDSILDEMEEFNLVSTFINPKTGNTVNIYICVLID